MALRDYAGNATPSTLVASITNVALAFDIPPADATSWPTGGANGKFFVTIDRGLPSEERLLATSQSGGSFTIAALGDRGLDGTSTVSHSAGATVEHTYSGVDAEEANAHINNAALDHHTQYMMASGTRHDLTARHSAGTSIPTAVPVAIGTALAEGAGTNLARSTHVHVIGVGAINAANMFSAGIVDQAAIGNAAVGTGELIDLNVTTGKLADNAVINSKIIDGTILPAKLGAASYGSPVAVGLANSNGVATTLARSDHVHDQPFAEARRDTGAGGGALTTAFVSQGATLSLPAGTWFVMAKWRSTNSTAGRDTHTARIQNTTDATTLDQADVSIDAAAADNTSQIVLMEHTTIAATKTFEVQAKTEANTGGTQVGSTCLLIAIKCTEIV